MSCNEATKCASCGEVKGAVRRCWCDMAEYEQRGYARAVEEIAAWFDSRLYVNDAREIRAKFGKWAG